MIFMLIALAQSCASEDEGEKAQSLVHNREAAQKPAESEQTLVHVSSQEFFALIEKHKGNEAFHILDIRTEGEYNAGYIEQAILMDYYASDFETRLAELDKEHTYLIYCRSGNRSGLSLSIFRDLDFQEVYNLRHGILDWTAAGYPLVQP